MIPSLLNSTLDEILSLSRYNNFLTLKNKMYTIITLSISVCSSNFDRMYIIGDKYTKTVISVSAAFNFDNLLLKMYSKLKYTYIFL